MKKEYLPTDTAPLTSVELFASYIGSLTDAKISGVFLERSGGGLQSVLRNMKEKHGEQAAAAGETFACCGKCRQKNEDLAIHCGSKQHNKHTITATIESVVQQSRFSDLLILDAEMSFDAHQNGILSELTKSVLKKTECPVMIAPYAFSGIGEIILAYDGSASAVFAIKQFMYLFPRLADKKITVLQVNNPGNPSITERHNILGLLHAHCSSVMFHTLNGPASETLLAYLAGKQNAIVVMGAFGSYPLSDGYRQSTAEPLVKTIKLPLFIAHQF